MLITTLLIFSLQKLKVFTVSQIPLHFHCVFYSHPLHAVDRCTHFGLQLEPAFDWESVAGSVIQATGTVEFEDGLRTGVLPGGCWCPCGGRT
jgi:hypothetical protein